MKKLLILLLLGAIAIPASGEIFIGIYTDPDPAASALTLDTIPYTEVFLYLVAWWDGLDGTDPVDGITAAEFRVENVPSDDGFPFGDFNFEAASPLIIGELDTSWSIAFDEPKGAADGYFTLGTMGIKAYNFEGAEWVGDDFQMYIKHTIPEEGPRADPLLVVVDDAFEILDANGQGFTINCTTGDCGFTATRSSNWSTLKALF